MGTVLKKFTPCQAGYAIRGNNPSPAFQVYGATPCPPYSDTLTATFPPYSYVNWEHLVATYSRIDGVMRTYKNGVLSQQVAAHTNVLLHSGDLYIGGGQLNEGDGSFVGLMKEVRIYNRTLSAFEVHELYSGNCLWDSATDVGGGWRHLDWFGNFVPYNRDWLWHNEHGWLYPVGTTTTNLWLWTSNSVYPFLWSSSGSAWLWYYKDTGNTSGGWFYNYGTGQVEWK